MGLSISYEAFNGAYSSFHRFRVELAKRMGISLNLMRGFYNDTRNMFTLLNYKFPKGDEVEVWQITEFKKMLPLEWDSFKPSPIHKLLYHSDCDGHINLSDVRKMIPKLEEFIDEEEDSEFQERLKTFIEGSKEAVECRSRLDFR